MCGICGTFGGNAIQNRLLALLNHDRGPQSVGFLVSGDNKTFKRYRFAESIIDATKSGRISKGIWEAKTFLCHTRAASPAWNIGGTKKENTHPFRCGHIIGAHNGYISNWDDLQKENKEKYPEVAKYEVDSQMIIFLLDKFGYKALAQLRGYASVWWMDDRITDKVFLWIWNQDLHIAKSPHVAFSSDGDHLRLAGYSKISKLKSNGQFCSIDINTGADVFIETVPGVNIVQEVVSEPAVGATHYSSDGTTEVWDNIKRKWVKWSPQKEKEEVKQLSFADAMASRASCAACGGTGKDSTGKPCWACEKRLDRLKEKQLDADRCKRIKAAIIKGEDIWWCDICNEFCLREDVEISNGKLYCGVCGAVVRNPDRGLMEGYSDAQEAEENVTDYTDND